MKMNLTSTRKPLEMKPRRIYPSNATEAGVSLFNAASDPQIEVNIPHTDDTPIPSKELKADLPDPYESCQKLDEKAPSTTGINNSKLDSTIPTKNSNLCTDHPSIRHEWTEPDSQTRQLCAFHI